MDDRKYRQSGYRENSKKETPRAERPRPRDLEGPRSPWMPGRRALSRCAECGTQLPPLADAAARCSKCGVELRSCRQCAYFEPTSRLECTQPIAARIADKRARNDCAHFSLRVTVERETSAGGVRPDDARRAFDNLFKR